MPETFTDEEHRIARVISNLSPDLRRIGSHHIDANARYLIARAIIRDRKGCLNIACPKCGAPVDRGCTAGFSISGLMNEICRERVEAWEASEHRSEALYDTETCPCAACYDTRQSQLPWPQSLARHMVLCPTCGNKRCPHATHHDNTCTGSNETGQIGSAYE